MRVGIINKKDCQKQIKLIGECDDIVIISESQMTKELFLELVKKNKDNQLVVPEIKALGLQLIQLLPGFKLVQGEKKIIQFIKRDCYNKLSEKEYFNELYYLALLEESKIKNRTKTAIKNAREKGIIVGRPSISNHQIEKIRDIHRKEKKTIREIAEICDVSLGTVHKYLNSDHNR